VRTTHPTSNPVAGAGAIHAVGGALYRFRSGLVLTPMPLVRSTNRRELRKVSGNGLLAGLHHFEQRQYGSPVAARTDSREPGVEVRVGKFGFGDAVGQVQINFRAADREGIGRGAQGVQSLHPCGVRRRREKHDVDHVLRGARLQEGIVVRHRGKLLRSPDD